MTLILTTVWHGGVSQVADRQVSRQVRPGQFESFDPDANKTVLFAASDAFVTISYSGPAYIEGSPTDEWIAAKLRGRPIDRGPDGVRPAAISGGRVPDWPRMRDALQRLTEAIDTVVSRLGRPALESFYLGVAIAGWILRRRKRPRAFGQVVCWRGDSRSPVITRSPRHFLEESRFWLVIEPDGYMSNDEGNELVRAFMTAVRDPDAAEQAVIAGLRRVALRRTGVVGPHCMCMLLPPPRIGWARVRFDSLGPQRVAVAHSRDSVVVPVAFSPWVVTQDQTLAPATVSGGPLTVPIGPWELRIESPTLPNSGIRALHFSQQRRPAP